MHRRLVHTAMLERAKIRDGARSLLFHFSAGYARRFSQEEASDFLLATHTEDETLSAGHGFPLTLVASGPPRVRLSHMGLRAGGEQRPGVARISLASLVSLTKCFAEMSGLWLVAHNQVFDLGSSRGIGFVVFNWVTPLTP